MFALVIEYICSTYERKRKEEVVLLKTRIGQVSIYEEKTIFNSYMWITLCGTAAELLKDEKDSSRHSEKKLSTKCLNVVMNFQNGFAFFSVSP